MRSVLSLEPREGGRGRKREEGGRRGQEKRGEKNKEKQEERKGKERRKKKEGREEDRKGWKNWHKETRSHVFPLEVKVQLCSEAGSDGVCLWELTGSRTGVISRCFPHRNWRSMPQVWLSE